MSMCSCVYIDKLVMLLVYFLKNLSSGHQTNIISAHATVLLEKYRFNVLLFIEMFSSSVCRIFKNIILIFSFLFSSQNFPLLRLKGVKNE